MRASTEGKLRRVLIGVLAFVAAASPGGAGEKGDAPKTSAVAVDEYLYTGDGFEGTFLQLSHEHARWSSARWRDELANLRRIGLDTLVLQWSAYGSTDFLKGPGESPIERVARATEEAGMDLYAGLALDPAWWNTSELDQDFLRRELVRNQKTADHLYDKLKRFKGFRGWYVPHEVTDLGYDDKQRELIIWFFKELTRYLNGLDSLKAVIASGYTDPDRSEPVRFALWWAWFLGESGIDVFVFQDGAGIGGRSDWKDVLPFVEAIVLLEQEFPGEIWLLAEVFVQTSGTTTDRRAFRAKPADFTRVRAQLDALGAFQRKLVMFSYFDYMRPSASEEATRLYEAYLRHIAAKVIPVGEPSAP